jgi:hypothetical protein
MMEDCTFMERTEKSHRWRRLRKPIGRKDASLLQTSHHIRGGADEKSVVVPSGGEWKALYPGPGHAVVLRCENAVNVRYLEFALQNFLLLLRRVPFVVRGHSLEAA